MRAFLRRRWFPIALVATFLAAFMITSAILHAQVTVPKNPTLVGFGSADHGVVTSYELGFRLRGAAAATEVIVPVAKSLTTVNGSEIEMDVTAPVRGLTLADYEFRVRAVALVPRVPPLTGNATIYSDWSATLVPFDRAPLPATGVRIVR